MHLSPAAGAAASAAQTSTHAAPANVAAFAAFSQHWDAHVAAIPRQRLGCSEADRLLMSAAYLTVFVAMSCRLAVLRSAAVVLVNR